MNQAVKQKTELEPFAPSAEPLSKQQPIWHVVVLSVLTCQAYPFYWFYKTWRDLSQAAACLENKPATELQAFAGISPLLRTIGMLVPIWHLFLAFGLIKGIAQLNPDKQSAAARHAAWAAGGVLVAIMSLLCLSALPGGLCLLSYSAFVPLCLAQHWLNKYWAANETKGLIVRHAFTGKELAAVISGSLWFGLVLASFWLVPQGTAGGAR